MVQTKEERKIVARIYRQKNKEQIAEKAREYYENTKERDREKIQHNNNSPAGIKSKMMSGWRRRGVINVNDEMYNNYIATTHCECCLKEFSSSRDRCLDHDHETGEFRWIICQSCNNHDYWKKKFNTHLVGKTADS